MSGPAGKVRWGIMGAAFIATKVSKAMHRASNAEPVAIASRSPEKGKAWAREHDIPRVLDSYEALLDDPEIDAVYLPLPPSLHLEWTTKAAQKKKHVLCEKPLARDADEAQAMADVCREHGVQLMDGVMWVHHERANVMRRQLDAGALGNVRRVTSAFTFNWDVVPEENIRLQKDLAGGSLGDLGYYCIRATWWALGKLPQRVWATARFYKEVDMNLSALMWFDGPLIASFDCGFDIGQRQWLEIAGTERSLVCDDFVLPVREEESHYYLHEPSGASSKHAVGSCVQEVRMIEDFSAIVLTGKLDPRWPAEAITTMRFCDALDRSARTGQPVDL